MKKLVPLTAIVMLCLSQHVCADEVGGGVQDASRAATVETAAAPTGEKAEWLAGEAYPTLVREGLKRLYEALKSFWLTLAFGDLEKVADHVMDKLWWYLFGSRPVQEESWHKFRTVFRSYLREWWLATPLVPVETLKTGVWQALQRLAGKDGQAVLGGLPEYEKVRKLVHEGKADVVGRWVEEIRRRMTQGVLERGPVAFSGRAAGGSGVRPAGVLLGVVTGILTGATGAAGEVGISLVGAGTVERRKVKVWSGMVIGNGQRILQPQTKGPVPPCRVRGGARVALRHVQLKGLDL
uniref:Dense granule protein n=1 Tax=Sarcocystis muris TaxID=5813 RepID=O43946_SARMU|nr:dense granule protein [Sarcocystis muris]AAC26784.1 dense-granule antigen DG32 [Sarcocystis muris]